jgi:hypothetical protein
MKTFAKLTKNFGLLITAMFFLSSCYEFAYVNQENDSFVNQTIQPEVCINVTDFYYDNLNFYPYFGVLIPKEWTMEKDFAYMKKVGDHLINIGQIHYSEKRSIQMNLLNPPPNGYLWQVGTGDKPITSGGIYMTYPRITTHSESGKYALTYAIANSYSGLAEAEFSEKKVIYTVDKSSPLRLKAKSQKGEIVLKWKKPLELNYLIGYDIYRNHEKINESLVLEEYFVDPKPTPGSHLYTVKAVYIKSKDVAHSAPVKICYCTGGTSLKLNGEGNGPIVLNNLSLNMIQAFTLEAWVKYEVDPLKNASTCPRIISKSYANAGYELLLLNNGRTRNVGFNTSLGNLTSHTLLEAGKWYHLAATFDGMRLKIYINGNLDAQQMVSGKLVHSNTALYIGQKGTSPYERFSGIIDEIRIWDRAISENQVRGNMSLLLNGNESGLVAYWNMNAGYEGTACDLTGMNNDAFLRACCWDVSHFPHLPEVSLGTGSKLSIPILCYEFPVTDPQNIKLVFKYNRDLFSFEGIELNNTQLKKWDVSVHTNNYGIITIEAEPFGTLNKQSDVMLYLNFKAKESNATDYIHFNIAKINGEKIRTQSGKMVSGEFYTRIKRVDVKSSGLIDDVILDTKIYPNPIQSKAQLTYSLVEDDHMMINILNINGQLVKFVLNEDQQAGNHTIKLDCQGMAAGVYFLTLQTMNSSKTTKLVINK